MPSLLGDRTVLRGTGDVPALKEREPPDLREEHPVAGYFEALWIPEGANAFVLFLERWEFRGVLVTRQWHVKGPSAFAEGPGNAPL